MYEYYEMLLERTGLTTADVCKATGIGQNVISNWKKRRHILNADYLKRIADFFNVTVDFLLTGKDEEKESLSGQKYYFDDSAAEAAQKMFEDKDLRLAFDAMADSSAEELKLIYVFIKALKEN